MLDTLVRERRADRGPRELAAGLLRSGLVVAGAAASGVAQLATAPWALLNRGGGEERLLENLGVEVGVVANKLIILTANGRALEESGDERGGAVVARLREETKEMLEAMLADAPEVMGALIGARALEPSYDLRTRRAAPGPGPDARAADAAPARTNGRAKRTPVQAA